MDKAPSTRMNDTITSPKVETNPVRLLAHSTGFRILLFALAHPILALVMRSSSLFATAHAVLTLMIGVGLALFSKDPRKAGYVAAYIAGAEVLWRMTDARIFWEGGKYFTVLILTLTLLRMRPWRRVSLPIVYFVLLCLSIPLALSSLDFSVALDAISFNLSGPLSLMICTLYFSQISGDVDSLRKLAWSVMIPVLGIATLTTAATLSAQQITFVGESNFITSGGFGPNQVSAVLGLGGALALLLFLMKRGTLQRWVALVLALSLLTLSALTFSRGGLYNAAVMSIFAMVHYMRNSRGRITMLALFLILGLVGSYLIFPYLNSFTGGMLQQRFSDLDPTLRFQIARADLNVWFTNPLLGVGPGLSMTERFSVSGFLVAAHTEYTRQLAEHGTAGLLALLIMLVMSIRAYLRAPNVEAQAWVAALLAWPLMEMSHAAMRIVAISFIFGLAMMNWDNSSTSASTGKTVS